MHDCLCANPLASVQALWSDYINHKSTIRYQEVSKMITALSSSTWMSGLGAEKKKKKNGGARVLQQDPEEGF